MSNEEFWVCPDCSQENFAASRFCELCGKLRGSSRPGPGPAVVSKFRGEGGQRPQRPQDEPRRRPPEESRRRAADEEAPRRKNKVSMLDFSERLRSMFRRPPESPRPRGGKRRDSFNPTLTLVLAFVVWGMIRLVGAPFLLFLKFVAFLFTPFGLPVWLALAYVYSRNRALIHGQINAMRERVQMFASVAARAAGSIAALRGGVASMFGRGARPEADERPSGAPVRGASVRILDEEWDDDYDDFDDEGRR